MIALKILQVLFWFVIIPYLLGKFLQNNRQPEYEPILYTWIMGYVLQMAIFMVISIPLILFRAQFKELRNLYFVIVVILSIISVWKYRKNLINIPKINKFSFFQVVAILLVFLQIFIRFKYSTVNNDDSSFVVISTQMIEYGDMYNYGEETELNSRRALAPISAYYAVISQYVFTHVTIVTHTFMPILFIVFANVVYYYFGKSLFNKDDKDSPFIFLIFMVLLNFYFFRIKGAGAYFLKFTWLGRVVVAGILLPFLWKVSLDAMNKSKNRIKDWLLIFFIVLASCLCSEMSIAIISIPVIILSIINAIRDKKPSYLLKAAGTVLPCLILAIIYLNIR